MDENEARIRALFIESLGAWQKYRSAQNEFLNFVKENHDFSEEDIRKLRENVSGGMPKDPEELTHSKKDEAWGNIKKKFDFKFE